MKREPVVLASAIIAFWILFGCFMVWSYHAYGRFMVKCQADIDNAAANVENVKYQRRIAEAMERAYPNDRDAVNEKPLVFPIVPEEPLGSWPGSNHLNSAQ